MPERTQTTQQVSAATFRILSSGMVMVIAWETRSKVAKRPSGKTPLTTLVSPTTTALVVLIAQPKYLAISAGGNDALCIAYIAVTSQDGDVTAWHGDVAKNCSVDWHYSRTVVGTASKVHMRQLAPRLMATTPTGYIIKAFAFIYPISLLRMLAVSNI